MAVIGLGTIGTGIGLMGDYDWSWGAGVLLSVLGVFVSFIELLGAINPYMIIKGEAGYGAFIGGATLVLSSLSLYLLYRSDLRYYFR